MTGWLRRLLGNGHTPADGTLHEKAHEIAKKSEEALKENQSTLAALEQIRRVEGAAREHR